MREDQRPVGGIRARAVFIGLVLLGGLAVSPSAPSQGGASTCLGLAVTIEGTGGSDEITGTPQRDSIDGRGGDDRINGVNGDDALCGGEGNDLLDGNDGDFVRLLGGPGADTLVGSAGRSRVTYEDHTLSVRASLDGASNDGSLGEGDNIRQNVEDIRGGFRNDVITGNGEANQLLGGPGTGRDFLEGGAGVDDLFGEDGDDELRAVDGVLDDLLNCGPGADLAELDLRDAGFLGQGEATVLGCESITIGAVDEGPNVRVSGRAARVTRSGTAPLRLSCPRRLSRPCRGRVELESAPRRGRPAGFGAERYRIAPGRTAVAAVELSSRALALVRRARSVRARATATERGNHGPKVTIQLLTLRAPR